MRLYKFNFITTVSTILSFFVIRCFFFLHHEYIITSYTDVLKYTSNELEVHYKQGSNLALVHLSWQALGQVKNDSNCPLDKQQRF